MSLYACENIDICRRKYYSSNVMKSCEKYREHFHTLHTSKVISDGACRLLSQI